MSDNNPLKEYMRTEKVFIPLPSSGIYYDDSIVKLDDSNELGIKPMTAIDEMTLETPDAMLNGEGIVKLIKSCCPAVKEPRLLTAADADAILLAIKLVSYGDELKFTSTCPNCEKENDFVASIRWMIDTMDHLDPPYVLDMNESVHIHLKPYSFNTTTKISLEGMETYKLLQSLSSEADVEEIEKITKYSKTFERITKLRVETIIDGIEKIVVSKDSGDVTVTDPNDILEFIQDVSRKIIDNITDRVNEINGVGVSKHLPVKCEHCEHEWETTIEWNNANFFE